MYLVIWTASTDVKLCNARSRQYSLRKGFCCLLITAEFTPSWTWSKDAIFTLYWTTYTRQRIQNTRLFWLENCTRLKQHACAVVFTSNSVQNTLLSVAVITVKRRFVFTHTSSATLTVLFVNLLSLPANESISTTIRQIGSVNTCVPSFSLSVRTHYCYLNGSHCCCLFSFIVWFRPTLTVLAFIIYNHSACLSGVFVCLYAICQLNTLLYIMHLNHIFHHHQFVFMSSGFGSNFYHLSFLLLSPPVLLLLFYL